MTRRHRRPLARHAAFRSPGVLRQLLTVLGAGAASVLVAALAVGAFVLSELTGSLAENTVSLGQDAALPAQPPGIGAYSGGFDVVITGIDECGPITTPLFGDRCADPESDVPLNDVNLLVHVSDAPRRVTVVSFPRDLMISIPACTDDDGDETSPMWRAQINTAFATGGLPCVAKTLGDLAGITVGYAAKLGFDDVIQITDAIGGVEVCIGGTGISDEHTSLEWEPGNRVIQGLDALQFLRTRHGVGDESDLGRISNQQQYMSRLARKVVSDEVLGDPAKLLRMATVVTDNVVTSDTLQDPVLLVRMALALKSVPFDDYVFLQYPTFPDPSDPNRVVPDEDSAEILWAAIAANQPLRLTGDVSPVGGAELVPDPNAPVDPDAPVDPNAPLDPNAVEPPEPTPGAVVDGRLELPPSITGTTPGELTCSGGNA